MKVLLTILFATAIVAHVQDQALEGKWSYESVQVGDDDRGPMHRCDRIFAVFHEDRMTFDKNPPVRFVLDAKAHPKKIDFIDEKGSLSGVYKIDGDKLFICWRVVPPGKSLDEERPRDFTLSNRADRLQVFRKCDP